MFKPIFLDSYFFTIACFQLSQRWSYYCLFSTITTSELFLSSSYPLFWQSHLHLLPLSPLLLPLLHHPPSFHFDNLHNYFLSQTLALSLASLHFVALNLPYLGPQPLLLLFGSMARHNPTLESKTEMNIYIKVQVARPGFTKSIIGTSDGTKWTI